jgi:RNA polymerase sigma-B factor
MPGRTVSVRPGSGHPVDPRTRTAPPEASQRLAARRRTDDELARLHVSYACTRDRRLRDELAAAYDGMAVALARRFPSRRESVEDFTQVARIGLFGAIDRFDPGRERPFVSFARATITGELKRHVRDRTWSMRMPRSLQEQWLAVVRTVDDLTPELGRSPRLSEVVARCGLTDEQVLEAMELGRSHQPAPLEARVGGDVRVIDLSEDDDAFTRVDDHDVLCNLLAHLDEREISSRLVDGILGRSVPSERQASVITFLVSAGSTRGWACWSGVGRSATAMGSSQHGHNPPGPSRRRHALHSAHR